MSRWARAAGHQPGMRPQRQQPLDRGGVGAVGEGRHGLGRRQADQPRHQRGLALALRLLAQRAQQLLEREVAAGGGKRHRQMHVVEHVHAGQRVRRHQVGHLLPAPADIDAGEVQPPEQRRGVAQVEQDAAPARAQQAVVDGERRGMVLAVDMVEREVPGIVDGEVAARAPSRPRAPRTRRSPRRRGPASRARGRRHGCPRRPWGWRPPPPARAPRPRA